MYKHGSVKKNPTILKIPLKTGLAVLFIAHPGKNKENKLCGFSQKGPIKRFGRLWFWATRMCMKRTVKPVFLEVFSKRAFF